MVCRRYAKLPSEVLREDTALLMRTLGLTTPPEEPASGGGGIENELANLSRALGG